MAIELPEGFQLDQPQQTSQPQGLPAGFQLDPVKPQAPEMGRGEAAFITATNPLNFGDEIKAGIAALTAKTFGGAATKDIDIGDLYREARNSERNKLKQAQETYPIQSGTIGFASDIPFEAAALGKVGLTGTSSIPKLAAAGGSGDTGGTALLATLQQLEAFALKIANATAGKVPSIAKSSKSGSDTAEELADARADYFRALIEGDPVALAEFNLPCQYSGYVTNGAIT